MTKILDGKKVALRIKNKLTEEIAGFSKPPKLAIFQVGDNPESTLYIKKKKEFAEQIGAQVEHFRFADSIDQESLARELKKVNVDRNFHGIILQLPLPSHLGSSSFFDEIDCQKDVDGLSSVNLKKLWNKEVGGFIPATAKGVLNILDFFEISLSGKRVVIIGRSALVGKPIALAFLNRDATITVSHRKTENLSEISRQAEILVVAIGQPNFVDEKFVSPGQIVIDVGINSLPTGKLEEEISGRKIVGDVDFEAVKDIVEAITPVPGGVGPLTVSALFENLISAYRLQEKDLIR